MSMELIIFPVLFMARLYSVHFSWIQYIISPELVPAIPPEEVRVLVLYFTDFAWFME